MGVGRVRCRVIYVIVIFLCRLITIIIIIIER